MTDDAPFEPAYEVVGDLSASRWRHYESCPRSYHAEHVEKRPSRPGTWAATGLLVHAALERLGRARLVLPPAHRGPATPAEVKRVLAELAASHGSARGRDGAERLEEARVILKDAAPTIGWTHVAAVEERHTFDVAGRQASVKWDRVDLEDGGAHVHVIDWKTGENVLARRDMLDDPQVGLYLVAARSRWPLAARVSITLHWLSRDLRLNVAWSPELDARVRARAADVLARLARETAWAPTPHGFCSACPHRRDCPAYLDLVRGPGADAALTARAGAALPALPDDELVRLRQRLAVVEKLSEAARRECDAELRARLDHREAFEAGGFRIRTQARRTFAPPPLAEVVALVLRHLNEADGPETDNLADAEDVERALVGFDEARFDALLETLPGPVAAAIRKEYAERRVVVDATDFVTVRAVDKLA